MKKFLKFIFSRLVFVGLALIFQIVWIMIFAWKMSTYYNYINILLGVLGFIAVLRIINKWDNPSYMLAWSIVILLIPIFGITLYIMFGRSGLTRWNRKKFAAVHDTYSDDLRQNQDVLNELKNNDASVARQSEYINDYAGYPLYKNTSTKYYSSGEDMFVDMLKAIKEAKHYIFLEFFIISKGEMWDTILELLIEKVKEGVDVRLIYDDVGCVNLLPAKYYKELQKVGIKCAAFNPFRPVVSVVMNNRNHRKILDIDGHTAFTGGINLADEYINKEVRFGYWKDAGIRIQGDGVWNFTIMFLEMWHYVTGIVENDRSIYKADRYVQSKIESDGFVQPYSDSPLDKENVGENVYLNIINKARDYVYIYTPYLIIDNEMMTALCLAAKSGIDVKIITPGIPDKKIVYLLTQSYYERLICAGVEIYQYTPGFVHAKCFVSDDRIATVGSVNLDYRSLYMHFECGVWMYESDSVMDVKNDFLNTLKDCEKISLEFCRNRPWIVRTFQGILRIIAPLF